jgi:hypothetical protein
LSPLHVTTLEGSMGNGLRVLEVLKPDRKVIKLTLVPRLD